MRRPPSAELSFEVATVKPVQMDASHRFDPKHFWVHVSDTRASFWSMTPAALIAYAYGVESIQITGPEWIAKDRFDIDARLPEGADKSDSRGMLQTLLKDRFKLTYHLEKRQLEGYALEVSQHGDKLLPSPSDPVTPTVDPATKTGESDTGDKPAKPAMTRNSDGSTTWAMGARGTQTVKFDQENFSQHWELSKMTMEDLASRLGGCMDTRYHKVVDETGKKGNYQVAYDCPIPRPQSQGAVGDVGTVPPDPQGSYLLTRSLDALGLKLEKRKMPMDVYVIDCVEKPSEN